MLDADANVELNGPALRRVRDFYGILQADVSRKLKVDQAWLCRIESGRTALTPAAAQRILHAIFSVLEQRTLHIIASTVTREIIADAVKKAPGREVAGRR